jgi:hypothetical protein
MNAPHPFSVDAMKTARAQGALKAEALKAEEARKAEVARVAEVVRRMDAVSARRAAEAAARMAEAHKAEEARKAAAHRAAARKAARLPIVLAKFHEAYQLRCNELSVWSTSATPLSFEIGFGQDPQTDDTVSALPCLLVTDGEFTGDIVAVAEAAGFNCANTAWPMNHRDCRGEVTYYGLKFTAA